MALFPKRPVKRLRDGRFEINIGDPERQIVAAQLEQLRDLLMGDGPLLNRLFPTAYPDDPDRDRVYQEQMRGPLLESHFAAIETMQATIDAKILDEAQLSQWLHTINALRLVVGTALDVDESTDFMEIEQDDPTFDLVVLYHVLTLLLSFVVDALTEALPPPTGGGPELPSTPTWSDRADLADLADLGDLPGLSDLTDVSDLGDIPDFPDIPDSPEGI